MQSGQFTANQTAILSDKRVSFDNTVYPQKQVPPKQSQSREIDAAGTTQTSFRFNSSHEILAFNQEQIAKIVPNPIPTGAKVDDKMLKIQKLKEKALLLQISREVNKPNQFVARKQDSKAPLNALSKSTDFNFKDPIPDDIAKQQAAARELARKRHTNETKILIDTREKFTKRF